MSSAKSTSKASSIVAVEGKSTKRRFEGGFTFANTFTTVLDAINIPWTLFFLCGRTALLASILVMLKTSGKKGTQMRKEKKEKDLKRKATDSLSVFKGKIVCGAQKCCQTEYGVSQGFADYVHASQASFDARLSTFVSSQNIAGTCSARAGKKPPKSGNPFRYLIAKSRRLFITV